ncbi:hypothetical protein BT93_L0407 [Corymbia citriodora subsp. variegata]|uniref:TIR domain-containing protein n=1 Tax=Corymbia citriodora subsp. variegata TaxID=360336 RepID=A0A8T0CPT9_CORYI|nr:hypothetical protein BT93_L0407 [Corymbia citriodora subsp. variegata]
MDISHRKGKKTMDISHVTNPSSSVSAQPDYEVFLSFRGPVMHRGFADFLYSSLTGVGIHVFGNKEELERGKEIDSQPTQAIEQSKVSIPVISNEYVSSESCLPELNQMVECMDSKNRIIIPIFYYVDPSDLRHCTGPFEKALGEHKKRDRDGNLLNHWMSALRRIGELKGHHLHERNEGSHGEFVKQIVHQVQQKLKKQDLIVTKQFVRVNSHVRDIMAKLKVDYLRGQPFKIGDTGVEVLGIYGMPGVGKTVLAKYVYNQLYHLFDACSFLGEIQAEINHHGIVSVQNKLISDLDEGNAKKFDRSEEALSHIRERFCAMKVLVLLDDVYNDEQFRAIVGDLDGLCPGSRVILTSQRQDVLRNIKGAESLVLEPMKPDEALKLFCRHAFGMNSPRKEFKKLSTDIVAATGRLPLALEVTGSSLFLIKSKKAWRETLTALKVSPHKRVQAALEKSYADLDTNAREIFLDIACFFTGMDERIPYYMWDDLKYSPSSMIPALQARSLVKIREDRIRVHTTRPMHEIKIGEARKLFMHEILKKFGWEIVKNENRNEPCNRSRLWDHEEALSVLNRKEGTQNVKALGLKFPNILRTTFQCDRFNGLQNLRFLKLDRANIYENLGDRLSSLRWLDWGGCPSFEVQLLNLNWQNLVILDLSGSQVDKDWSGWELLVLARKLKVLNLTDCGNLIATPKFPASMELERLILKGCFKLIVIDTSIGNLKKLVSLNMNSCHRLRELPDLGPMRSLKELFIDGTSISRIIFQIGSMMMLETLSACNCARLTEISDSIGSLESLTYLALDSTAIVTLPESIEWLDKLNKLSLKNCLRLSDLPVGIGKLRSLQFLDLSNTLIRELPPSVKNLKDMKVLRMTATSIREFPPDILNLEKLEEIDFSSCRSLEGKIPDDIGRLSSLAILKLSGTRISGQLPSSISRLSRLQEICISRCDLWQS